VTALVWIEAPEAIALHERLLAIDGGAAPPFSRLREKLARSAG
jgi:hypothetical protein